MQSVLVTGAPGWLGNRLIKGLLQGLEDFPELPRALRVRALVLPGLDVSLLKSFPALEFREGDVTRTETLSGVAEGCDTVIHCVGIIHPKRIKDLYLINTEGTRNMLQEAIRSGVKRFVFVSSNSPAGTNISRDRLFREEDGRKPYMHYGRSKAMAEDVVNEAFRAGKIETVIVRPCWFYGPGQPARQSEFFTMIKKGRPPLFGDGHNLRSMSYVDNLVQGLILASTVERAKGNLYWIADRRPYETIEIYETIARFLGVKSLRYLRIPGFVCELFKMVDVVLQAFGLYFSKIHVAGEMNKDIACSVEKAVRELGYNPKIGLEEGMRRSIEWCRQNGDTL